MPWTMCIHAFQAFLAEIIGLFIPMSVLQGRLLMYLVGKTVV